MNEENFEIVDEHDEVMGSAPRSEVHRRGLRHRAVHVLVFNSQGKLFLQKRSLGKDCFPGTWDSSASGHVAVDESYDACAVREVQEELGVSLSPPAEPLFKLAACPKTGMEFVWVYRASAEGPFTLHPDEIDEGGWFSVTHIDRWMHERPHEFAGSMPLIWAELLKRGLLAPG